ncbi:IS5 family transposase [Streptomyces lavendulae]|uniref:IS5 family transposase n=1 Tax=Streptomyces lavendulae TaxID=1914 RepID=UPI0036B2CFB5
MGRDQRGDLSDAEWERLWPFLPVSNGRCGRWRDHRQVIDGILHRVRTGVQWRDLPERFGPWKTVYERHRLWSADGTWEHLLQQIQAAADAAGDVDWDVSVESTSVRAHQHADGARNDPPPTALLQRGATRRNRAAQTGQPAPLTHARALPRTVPGDEPAGPRAGHDLVQPAAPGAAGPGHPPRRRPSRRQHRPRADHVSAGTRRLRSRPAAA